MQQRNWYPQSPTTSSFIFFKRFDTDTDQANMEVNAAIVATRQTYPNADYSFAVLKPVGIPANVAENSENDMLLYLNHLFSNDN
jgi:hypothetical protein